MMIRMDCMVEPKTVEIFGQWERVGDWMVVDSGLTKVLATDPGAEGALRKAGIDPNANRQGESRPVLMQVPDPSATCLY